MKNRRASCALCHDFVLQRQLALFHPEQNVLSRHWEGMLHGRHSVQALVLAWSWTPSQVTFFAACEELDWRQLDPCAEERSFRE